MRPSSGSEMLVDRRGWRWLFALSVLTACARPPPPPEPSRPAAVRVPITPKPPSSASASDAGFRAAEDDAGPAFHRLPIAMPNGSCTLLVRARSFEETPDAWILQSVTWLSTESGDTCVEDVLFDTSDGDDPLEAGVIGKPGKHRASDAPAGGVLADLSFDGHPDLCIVAIWGAYNYSQRCFVFTLDQSRFVRNEELEEMIFMDVDEKQRVLRSAHRVSGPIYQETEKRWISGKLVTTKTTTTWVGEKPDGSPLPSGKSWFEEHVLKGDRLVKVRSGVR